MINLKSCARQAVKVGTPRCGVRRGGVLRTRPREVLKLNQGKSRAIKPNQDPRGGLKTAHSALAKNHKSLSVNNLRKLIMQKSTVKIEEISTYFKAIKMGKATFFQTTDISGGIGS